MGLLYRLEMENGYFNEKESDDIVCIRTYTKILQFQVVCQPTGRQKGNRGYQKVNIKSCEHVYF